MDAAAALGATMDGASSGDSLRGGGHCDRLIVWNTLRTRTCQKGDAGRRRTHLRLGLGSSANHLCCSASWAVMRRSGSYMNMRLRRSTPCGERRRLWLWHHCASWFEYLRDGAR